MPFPSFHAARMVDPDKFIASTFRTKEITPGISIIIGKQTESGPMETQAYRFDKTKFTEEEARKWLKDHDMKFMSFEKAAVSNLVSIDNEGSFMQSHDVNLQRLDIHLPFGGVPGGKLRYDVDNFAGTESDWDKVPAIFVPEGVPIQHPDHAAIANDPQSEARRLGYKIAGYHTQTKVIGNGPGEPRVTTKVVFTDPNVDELASMGKLSPSTGFDANIVPDGYMEGKVTPNHVLYFIRNGKTAFGTPATPNDLGATVNNLSKSGNDHMTDDETKTVLQKISDKVDNILSHAAPKVEDKTVELQTKIKALEVKNVEDMSEIETLKARIKELEAMLAEKEMKLSEMDNLAKEVEKQKKDAEWTQVKNLYAPGMFHKPEDEAAHRAKFEENPAQFMIANVGNLSKIPIKATVVGKEAVGNINDDGPVDVAAIRGKYNWETHKFEGGRD